MVIDAYTGVVSIEDGTKGHEKDAQQLVFLHIDERSLDSACGLFDGRGRTEPMSFLYI